MKLTLEELNILESILHNYIRKVREDENGYVFQKWIDQCTEIDIKLMDEILKRYNGKRSD